LGDADKEDDIDFFIITKKDTLFKTRLLVLLALQLLGLRRKRLEKNPADKICVNFLIDETKLSFSKDKRDIYTAHEILQIKPLFFRDNIYSRFLKANTWVYNFLPNAISSIRHSKPFDFAQGGRVQYDMIRLIFLLINFFTQ
jgi:hypothetical protein